MSITETALRSWDWVLDVGKRVLKAKMIVLVNYSVFSIR